MSRQSRTSVEPRCGQGLLSVHEAAEFLDIAEGTLRNWLSARRLPYVKMGRRTKLSRRDLENFVAAHTVDAASADAGVAWDTGGSDESL